MLFVMNKEYFTALTHSDDVISLVSVVLRTNTHKENDMIAIKFDCQL